jgi:hypothetical protein
MRETVKRHSPWAALRFLRWGEGKQTDVRSRKSAKGGSSPPSDLPDNDSTRRVGIRNAAASGSGKEVNSEDAKARSGNDEMTWSRAHSGSVAYGGGTGQRERTPLSFCAT